MCDKHMSRVMSDTHVSFTCVTHTRLEFVWHTNVSFICVTNIRRVYICDTHMSRMMCNTYTSRLHVWHCVEVVWHTRVSCICVTHTRHVYMCYTQKPIGYRVHDLYTYNSYYVRFVKPLKRAQLSVRTRVRASVCSKAYLATTKKKTYVGKKQTPKWLIGCSPSAQSSD